MNLNVKEKAYVSQGFRTPAIWELKFTTNIFSVNLYGSNMCWEALGPYHSWDKILLCAQSLIRMKIPEDMIENPKQQSKDKQSLNVI